MRKTVLNLRRSKVEELTEDLNKIYTDYYSGLNREDFDRVIALDPTFTPDVAVENNKLGQYGKWLLLRFKKGELDETQAREILSDFDERKKYLKNNESKGEGKEANKGTDINAYKSIEEVRNALDCIELTTNQRAKIARKQRQFADLGDSAVFIAENDNWEVWRPLTYAADAKLGERSTWCTASSRGGDSGYGEGSGYFYQYTVGSNNPNKHRNLYPRYSADGKLYVFLNKNNKDEKFQARVDDESRKVTDFMDINDSSANFSEFIAASGLLDVLLNSELRDVKDLIKANNLRTILEQDVLYVVSVRDLNTRGYRPTIRVVKEEDVGNPEAIPTEIRLSTIQGTSSKLKKMVVLENNSSDELPTGFPYNIFKELDFSRCEGLKTIYGGTFRNCNNIHKVTLPDSIKTIGKEAFRGCSSLEEVNLPKSLSLIEYGAFIDCNNVKLIKARGQKISVTRHDAESIKSHLSIISDENEVKEESLELTEALSASMPQWLKDNLKTHAGRNRVTGDDLTVKDMLAHEIGINIQNAEFITPESIPTNGANKYCKGPYVGIFHIKYESGWREIDTIIAKDFENNIFFGNDTSAPWASKYMNLSECSIGTLLAHTVEYCCVDRANEDNMTHSIKQTRADAKNGSIDRLSAKDAEKEVKKINDRRYYGNDNLKAYVDKSGYIVDPQKLVDELQLLHRNEYSKSLKGYYQRLKTLKKEIISEYSTVDIKNGRRDESDLINIFNSLNTAIKLYRDIVTKLNSILKVKDKGVKNNSLDDLFLNRGNLMNKLRDSLLSVEQDMREHSFEVIETLSEAFKEWCGEELFEEVITKTNNEFTLRDCKWWMANKTPSDLKEYLKIRKVVKE